MEFTITRSKWMNGSNSDLLENGGVLYDPDKAQHNMCCLGQILEQCGMSRTRLINAGTPAELTGAEDVAAFLIEAGPGVIRNSTLAKDAMEMNDRSEYASEAQRERALTQRFADDDITLTFQD